MCSSKCSCGGNCNGKCNHSHESSFNNKYKKTMNKVELNSGIIGAAMGQNWALVGEPLEVGFTQAELSGENPGLSSGVIAAGAGQSWGLVGEYSFLGIGENKNRLNTGFGIVNPIGIYRRNFCGRYCKSLGYLRSSDKQAWKVCVNDCMIHFTNIKKGKYKIKPFDAMGSADVDALLTETEKDTKISSSEADKPISQSEITDIVAKTAQEPKSNLWIYIGAGIGVLLIAFIIIMIMRRKK